MGQNVGITEPCRNLVGRSTGNDSLIVGMANPRTQPVPLMALALTSRLQIRPIAFASTRC